LNTVKIALLGKYQFPRQQLLSGVGSIKWVVALKLKGARKTPSPDIQTKTGERKKFSKSVVKLFGYIISNVVFFALRYLGNSQHGVSC